VKWYAKDSTGKKEEQRVRLSLLDDLQPKVFQNIRASYQLL